MSHLDKYIRILTVFVLLFCPVFAQAGAASSRQASNQTADYVEGREGTSAREAEAHERLIDARLCADTGGTWRENLVSCRCATGQLFSGQDGCLDEQDWREYRARSVDAVQTMSLYDFDREGVAGRLQDQQLSSRYPEHVCVYLAGHPSSADAFKKQVVNIIERVLDDRSLERRSAVSAAAGPALSEADTLSRCRELTGSDASCRSIVAALGEIRGTAPLPYRLSAELTGYLVEDRISLIGASEASAHFIVASTSGVVTARILVHNVPHTLGRLALLLAPDGSIVGGGWQTIDKAPTDAPHLLNRRRVIFDDQMRPVGDADVWHLGDKDDLRAATAHALSGSPPAAQAVEKAQLEALHGGAPRVQGRVAAMLFETTVDLRARALWPFLAWDRAAAETFVATGALTEPLLGPTLQEVHHLRALAADEGGAMTHGSQVMSRLVAGLDGVTVYPFSMDSLLSEPDLLGAGLLPLLQPTIDRHRVRVVNISQSYPYDGIDCEALFGPLMRHYESEVLFVAAAPNSGEKHLNFCPMQLKDTHPNLVVVGGITHPPTAREGERAPDAGAGRTHMCGADASTVLTQLYQPVFSFSGEPRRGSTYSLRVDSEPATSFATPAVANLALRLWAASSDLSVQDIIAILQAHVVACDLPGDWGGYIDTTSRDGERAD